MRSLLWLGFDPPLLLEAPDDLAVSGGGEVDNVGDFDLPPFGGRLMTPRFFGAVASDVFVTAAAEAAGTASDMHGAQPDAHTNKGAGAVHDHLT